MSQIIDVSGHKVGVGQPVFVIAEAGVNHNGSLDKAYGLIDAAVAAGANAVKFQTFKTDLLVTLEAPKAAYQQQTTDKTETQYEMLKRLELSVDAHRDLIAYCAKRNIIFMSTPFEENSADLLDNLGVPIFKIPSGEINNVPFLTYVAQMGKPIILSTGMSHLGEVELAVQTVRKTGNQELVLLHCVSNYPADALDVNLRAMQTMAVAFGCPVGYSDHTLGNEALKIAYICGAQVMEFHFTDSREGKIFRDHKISLTYDEVLSLIKEIKKINILLGIKEKKATRGEIKSNHLVSFRRAIYSNKLLKAGHILKEEDLVFLRPNHGLDIRKYKNVIGKKIKKDTQPYEKLELISEKE